MNILLEFNTNFQEETEAKIDTGEKVEICIQDSEER
jgi:hypothetical protein